MRGRRVMLLAVLLAFSSLSSLAGAQSPRMILALGNTGFLNTRDIEAATGVDIRTDLWRFELKDFAVVVLANVAFMALPAPVQQGLVEYVNGGGAVLITGGPQSFGSGGYEQVASILPFQILFTSDWRGTPFRAPLALQPNHPILAGVTFISVGNLNHMALRGDATAILQAAGGGSAGGGCIASGGGAGKRTVGGGCVPAGPGGSRPPGVVTEGGGSNPYPLISEARSGSGRVLGVAFDLNEFSGMPDRDLLLRNTLAYLLSASRIGQAR